MNDLYRRTSTTVSYLCYHFVFCPKYRRKIFLIPGVEDRFKQLAREICDEHEIEIMAMECHVDHVHLFVNALPSLSPADIMKYIKGGTSRQLRDEFEVLKRMTSLWTRSYFVSSAGQVSADTIRHYVETQKTR